MCEPAPCVRRLDHLPAPGILEHQRGIVRENTLHPLPDIQACPGRELRPPDEPEIVLNLGADFRRPLEVLPHPIETFRSDRSNVLSGIDHDWTRPGNLALANERLPSHDTSGQLKS